MKQHFKDVSDRKPTKALLTLETHKDQNISITRSPIMLECRRSRSANECGQWSCRGPTHDSGSVTNDDMFTYSLSG